MRHAEHQQTAQVLAFPAGGRAGMGRFNAQPRIQAPEPPRVECGSWYHQAALDESRRGASK
ncbi:DUF2735 domain-containing protein [Methylopila jiangsuensis]|uniref:DUF2735 domain-containing protein n=1 Tax=Methylopila jiangsuensis TaxID=586230 RepID=UPI003D17F2B0